MQLLTVFACVVAMACGLPTASVVVPAPAMESTPWTLSHLSEALQNPATNPELVPYLETALNEMMDALSVGENPDIIMVAMPAGVPLEVSPVAAVPEPVIVSPAVPEPVIVGPAMESTPWTVAHLAEALQNPATNPELIPYLETALNDAMAALISGQNPDIIMVAMPAGVPLEVSPVAAVPEPVVVSPAVPEPVIVGPAMESTPWTVAHLAEALQNPATNPELIPYLETALNDAMDALISGQNPDIIMVAMPAGVPLEVSPVAAVPEPVIVSPAVPEAVPVGPAMESTPWTLAHLTEALQNPATNPELIPYLEAALNDVMTALISGESVDVIMVAMPAGVALELPVAPVDVPVAPVDVAPVETPTSPAVPTGPLVQIILNINVEEQVASAPSSPVSVSPAAPTPIEPVSVVEQPQEPVTVVDQAPVVVAPVNPIDVIAVAAPETVAVASPEIIPVAPVNPIDVIAVAAPETVAVATPEVVPVAPVNPIDVIAVAAPETVAVATPEVIPVAPVNPIDVIAVAAPETVAVATPEVVPVAPANPIDVIAVAAPEIVVVAPTAPANPIDVVAVSAPEVNPIDILNPVIAPVSGAVGGPLV